MLAIYSSGFWLSIRALSFGPSIFGWGYNSFVVTDSVMSSVVAGGMIGCQFGYEHECIGKCVLRDVCMLWLQAIPRCCCMRYKHVHHELMIDQDGYAVSTACNSALVWDEPDLHCHPIVLLAAASWPCICSKYHYLTKDVHLSSSSYYLFEQVLNPSMFEKLNKNSMVRECNHCRQSFCNFPLWTTDGHRSSLAPGNESTQPTTIHNGRTRARAHLPLTQ